MEEKGLFCGLGIVFNFGLFFGFYKGMLCVMSFDKYVEAFVMDYVVFYDICV